MLRPQGVLLGGAAGGSLAAAWLMPGSLLSSLFTWVSTLLIVLALETESRRSSFTALYLTGCISHLVAFHWLFTTIKDFGGFPVAAAAAIFGLFVVVSGLQFPLAGIVYRLLPKWLDSFGLRGAIAWVTLETLFFRIFPWQLGDTHIGLLPLVQIADIGGVTLVSFFTFWLCEVMVGLLRSRVSFEVGAAALLALLGCVGYGYYKISEIDNLPMKALDVALIQGNITIEEKHDMKSFTVNRKRYLEISESKAQPGILIIWPESVINEFVSAKIRDAYLDTRLPQMPQVSFLIGALTMESRTRYFNSALAIDANMHVAEPYHKQILMPFGEFTPFGDQLPWLKELNSTAPNFTAGDGVRVFQYPRATAGDVYGVAPLICYEDIVPRLSREATYAGAELLVNLTNDAWFGNTVAPYQHHLIALFRAIENRRYLLRSTNSGLTAVVDPVGRTVSQLRGFSEGSLLEKVNLISYRSLYTEFVGEAPWLFFSVFIVAVALAGALFERLGFGRSIERDIDT